MSGETKMQSKNLLMLLGVAALVCTGVAVVCGVLLLANSKSTDGGNSSSSLSSSTAADVQQNVTEPPSVTPSSTPRPSSGMRIVRFPTGEPTDSLTTTAPTAQPVTSAPSPSPSETRIVRFPTAYPTVSPSKTPITQQPSSSPTVPPMIAATFAPFKEIVPPTTSPISETSPPVFNDIPDPSQVFRIKMNWEEDYFWQDDPTEYFWCIACAVCDEPVYTEFPEEFGCQSSYCAPGDQLWIRDCQEDYGAEFRVNRDDQPGIVLEVLDSGRSQTVPGQCMARSENRYLQVQSCNASDTRQRWRSISSTQPFPLIPYYNRRRDDNQTYCVTQHHHPKSYEMLGLIDCLEPMNDNTYLWGVYPLAE